MRRTLAALALTLAFASGCTPHTAPRDATPPMPACPTEDSTGCMWDASKQGNGQGRSFVVDAQGRVTYLP